MTVMILFFDYRTMLKQSTVAMVTKADVNVTSVDEQLFDDRLTQSTLWSTRIKNIIRINNVKTSQDSCPTVCFDFKR